MRKSWAWVWGLVVFVAGVSLATPPQFAGARAPDFSGVKNVILFIGDGMGPKEVQLGELMSGGPLWTQAEPWTMGRVDTRSLDGVTDSAAAATALATGVATYNGQLATAPDGTPVETVLERAQAAGMATGLVSTSEDVDATAAAFASHVTNRDRSLAITGQILEHNVDVLLSSSWSDDYLLKGRSGVTYVENSSDLAPYLAGQTPWPTSLYGFPGKADQPLNYNIDREEVGAIGVQPTLTDFTTAALGVLGQDPNGFFLMVEGGQIDWCGHQRDAACDAAEVEEFARAVQVGLDFANGRDDTLVLVTADHETGGLDFGSGIDTSVIAGQSASDMFMWRQIKNGSLTLAQTLATYAGISDLTRSEKRQLTQYDSWKTMMEISDVMSAREHLSWGWSDGVSASHTARRVLLFAFGPGQDEFAGRYANEHVGRLLLEAVSD